MNDVIVHIEGASDDDLVVRRNFEIKELKELERNPYYAAEIQVALLRAILSVAKNRKFDESDDFENEVK